MTTIAGSFQRRRVLFRHNARLLFGDPSPVLLFLLVPLLMMAIFRPTAQVVLHREGFLWANGSQQVVPAFTAMFSFFWVRSIGELFFLEHGWRTWERLQSTSASAFDLVFGKIGTIGAMMIVQFAILLPSASFIYGLKSKGPAYTLALPCAALILCILSLGIVLVAVFRTMASMDVLATLLTLMFGTFGGAFVAYSALPTFAQDISPFTPVYWFMEAWHNVTLEGDGISGVLAPTGVLLLFTAAFTVVGVLRFRVGQTKVVGA